MPCCVVVASADKYAKGSVVDFHGRQSLCKLDEPVRFDRVTSSDYAVVEY